MRPGRTLADMYQTMLDRLGPSGWWPARTPFEVAVGTILAQNTNWSNAAKAIGNLRSADLLSPTELCKLSKDQLEILIRPSGYYRMKAARLMALLDFLDTHSQGEPDEQLSALRKYSWMDLRPLLLSIKGVGPETADSILCYALEHPVFVVDAYTARIAQRHGLIHEEADYHELQALFMDSLHLDFKLCNEFHALLVRVGNGWCAKKAPHCSGCPLESFLE
ncbi:DNA-3-methyladenine glycosylase III [Paucidesulfovibrio gracilis DSM 16080]|uniref:DNA-3-methyladenine glycosylase III n=2 Tax=Paucidesulfovibrio TaxID=2910985 RepID=A0A1T4WMN9_9BACT|nr:DNA-3-methyladenine glycosylase III [Paucidesulfovibrio gracilis DSM 16080]